MQGARSAGLMIGKLIDWAGYTSIYAPSIVPPNWADSSSLEQICFENFYFFPFFEEKSDDIRRH